MGFYKQALSDTSLTLVNTIFQAGVDEDASVSVSQLSLSSTSADNQLKGVLPESQTGVSMSAGEAQRMISLYFALCTKVGTHHVAF